MGERDGSDRGAALGAMVLAAALVLSLLIVGLRLATGGRPGVPPTPTPVPTAVPTATATPAPPTPTPLPQPTAAPTVPAVAGSRKPIVCLDPGHGGSDLGNVRVENGKIVLQEKDFTLAVGLALQQKLQADGFEVVMTRSTDSEVNTANADVNGDGTVAAPGGEAKTDQLDDLQARINLCNAANADLLMSIHFNGAENTSLEGFEVWYNDKRPFSDRNAAVASMVYDELGKQFAAAGYNANPHGIGTDDLAVLAPARPGKLVPSNMPGVLAEGLYLSNDDDAKFITSANAADVLATAYELAIKRYFAEYPV